MVKVTFQTGSGGVYWAVCEMISINSGTGAYLLIDVMEDSGGRGPLAWEWTAPGWRVVTVEEV